MTHYPEIDILQPVRAAFVGQGTTLAQWCREHKVDSSWAWRALQGAHKGPRALELRAQITKASGAVL